MSTLNPTQTTQTEEATKFAREVNFGELTQEQKVSFIRGVRAAGRLLRQVQILGNMGDQAPCEMMPAFRGGIKNQVLMFGRTLSELQGDKFAFIGFDSAMTSHLHHIENVGIPHIEYYEFLQAQDFEITDMDKARTIAEMQAKNAGLVATE